MVTGYDAQGNYQDVSEYIAIRSEFWPARKIISQQCACQERIYAEPRAT